MRPDFSVEKILSVLDECAESYNFPILSSEDIDLAEIRLTAFHGADEWLILFEELEVFRRRKFVNGIFAYGNKLSKLGVQGSDDLILKAAQGQYLWDEVGNFQLDPRNFRIRTGQSGAEYHFTPSEEDYQRAGVDLNGEEDPAANILRFLVHEIPTELYATDDRLLRLCGRGEPLTRFLRLEGWRHPDIADDELPSDSPCFQRLANALVTGDPAAYECDPAEWNTHWSAWPGL